jgi:hypothetical protein
MDSSPKRVFLHVGAPKTGTSQLQDLLFLNRDVLREHGVLYPAERFDDHFMAALDLLGKEWGGLEERAPGAWDRLVAEVNAFEGPTAVISHEVLAGASAEQAAMALSGLDGELHVVCSARDLRRQVPAEWQEGIKHRRTLTYAAFCADIRREEPRTQLARWFWTVQDVPAVLARWGAVVAPERVHLVTVPPPEAPRELLMQRFLGLLGIDPDWLERPSDRANASMGAVETTFIRKLNGRLPGSELPGDIYRPYVRELLVHRTLAGRPDSVRIALPDGLEDWVEERAARWLEQLSAAGYDVVGDLAELAPSPPKGTWHDPDAVPDDRVELALDVAETLLRELAGITERHRHELEEARSPPPPPPPGPWTRFKQRVVTAAGRNRALGIPYAAYRRILRR